LSAYTTLLVLVLREIMGFPGIYLVGALIGSVCGDIFLDLPREGMFILWAGIVDCRIAQ